MSLIIILIIITIMNECFSNVGGHPYIASYPNMGIHNYLFSSPVHHYLRLLSLYH